MLRLAKLAKPLLVSAGLLVPGRDLEQPRVHSEFAASEARVEAVTPLSTRAPVVAHLDLYINTARLHSGLGVEDLLNVIGILDAMLIDTLGDPACLGEEISKACPPEDEFQPGQVLISFVNDERAHWPSDGDVKVREQLRLVLGDRYPDASLEFISRDIGRSTRPESEGVRLCLGKTTSIFCPAEMERTPKGMFRVEVLMFEAAREI